MENPQTEAEKNPLFRSFKTDFDIKVGDTVAFPAGTEVTVRKPRSGELRGLNLLAISQLDYASIETLAPRITTPVLHKQHVAAMDPADLMMLGGEIMDFLLPRAAKQAASLEM